MLERVYHHTSTSTEPAFILDDDFEMFLASKEDNSNQTLERNNLTIYLTLYPLYSENQERLPHCQKNPTKSNVLEFRSSSMLTQLSRVANILLATPATPVSVKRLFLLGEVCFFYFSS
jgi:hypothetical protein